MYNNLYGLKGLYVDDTSRNQTNQTQEWFATNFQVINCKEDCHDKYHKLSVNIVRRKHSIITTETRNYV